MRMVVMFNKVKRQNNWWEYCLRVLGTKEEDGRRRRRRRRRVLMSIHNALKSSMSTVLMAQSQRVQHAGKGEGGRGNTYSSDFPVHPNDLHSHCPHHRPRSLECSACWRMWTGPLCRTGSLHQTHRSVTRTSFLVLDNDTAKHTEPTHASATCTHRSKLSENTASNFQWMVCLTNKICFKSRNLFTP